MEALKENEPLEVIIDCDSWARRSIGCKAKGESRLRQFAIKEVANG